jgi:hypothetical protein
MLPSLSSTARGCVAVRPHLDIGSGVIRDFSGQRRAVALARAPHLTVLMKGPQASFSVQAGLGIAQLVAAITTSTSVLLLIRGGRSSLDPAPLCMLHVPAGSAVAVALSSPAALFGTASATASPRRLLPIGGVSAISSTSVLRAPVASGARAGVVTATPLGLFRSRRPSCGVTAPRY